MREDAATTPHRGCFDGTMKMHALLRKIERAGMDAKDTNKAVSRNRVCLPGTAAGIGLELPLATHRIFCRRQPKARYRPARDHWSASFPGAGGHKPVLDTQTGRDGGVTFPAGRQDVRSCWLRNLRLDLTEVVADPVAPRQRKGA